jgi:hypothetical protein
MRVVGACAAGRPNVRREVIETSFPTVCGSYHDHATKYTIAGY